MKAQIITKEGTISGSKEILEAVSAKANIPLLHRVFISARSNSRLPWASTLGRGEVRGGGIKPWRQKGTGNARAGSSRSPLFRGGGITFGPKKERNFAIKTNKKERASALKSVLSELASSDRLYILENLEIKKTKEAGKLFSALVNLKKKLFILSGKEENLALRNLPATKVIRPEQLGMLELSWADGLILDEESLKFFEEKFQKDKKSEIRNQKSETNPKSEIIKE